MKATSTGRHASRSGSGSASPRWSARWGPGRGSAWCRWPPASPASARSTRCWASTPARWAGA